MTDVVMKRGKRVVRRVDQGEARRVLRELVALSGWSQEQFSAEVLVRSPGTVSNWVQGRQPIPWSVVSWLERRTGRVLHEALREAPLYRWTDRLVPQDARETGEMRE